MAGVSMGKCGVCGKGGAGRAEAVAVETCHLCATLICLSRASRCLMAHALSHTRDRFWFGTREEVEAQGFDRSAPEPEVRETKKGWVAMRKYPGGRVAAFDRVFDAFVLVKVEELGVEKEGEVEKGGTGRPQRGT